MNISVEKLIALRKERGWSQEKLAAISGVSERTIQRVEKDGMCSLDSKMAFAAAFEISPLELKPNFPNELGQSAEWKISVTGIVGLFVLGLLTPIILMLTSVNGKWEVVSMLLVFGLTYIYAAMNYGFKQTYQLFDHTSWIVEYPTYVNGLNASIIQAKSVIEYAYIVGVISSMVCALTIVIHALKEFNTVTEIVTYAVRPFIYALVFSELWFRPYKKRMETMLLNQMQ